MRAKAPLTARSAQARDEGIISQVCVPELDSKAAECAQPAARLNTRLGDSASGAMAMRSRALRLAPWTPTPARLEHCSKRAHSKHWEQGSRQTVEGRGSSRWFPIARIVVVSLQRFCVVAWPMHASVVKQRHNFDPKRKKKPRKNTSPVPQLLQKLAFLAPDVLLVHLQPHMRRLQRGPQL